MSAHKQEFVRQHIKKLLDTGVIIESQSDWASPLVLVPKATGELRMCVDYRDLNERTRKDQYPLPRIEDRLNVLRGMSIFAFLDLFSGFYQVRMKNKDIHKTAFVTFEGLYEFVVTHFGLINAPSTFQRMVNKLLETLRMVNKFLETYGK